MTKKEFVELLKESLEEWKEARIGTRSKFNSLNEELDYIEEKLKLTND